MENRNKTQQEIEQEMLELNEQFNQFLHTKGIKSKFKVAFANMAESARKQHAEDKANFEAVKAKSIEENKDFVEFLHTKGLKAKCKLVIENIKRGAKEAPRKTAADIAKVKAETQAAVASASACGKPACETYSAQTLADEFNAFLKSKGLGEEYTVTVTKAED